MGSAQHHRHLRKFIYQQDGCGPHCVNSIIRFSDAKDINVLPRPAYSPYLKPIEHVWAILNGQIRQHGTYPSNLDEFFSKLRSICNEPTDEYSSALEHSMPRRLAAVVKNEGSSTKY